MGFSDGTITFNSPSGAYYAGQVISGNVSFTLEQPAYLSVITVTFIGEAKVDWQENNGEECSGQEQYFNVTQPLCGGQGFFTLPPGGHQFSFQYQIPFEVPGTYCDDIATIRFYVQITAESPTGPKETLKEEFTVVSPLDLNSCDDYKRPLELEIELEDVGCCFGSRPVQVTCRAPVSGYCPGQDIPVTVTVDNPSDVEVRRLLFEIVTRMAYRSQCPRSEMVSPPQVVARVKRGPVLRKAAGDLVVRVPLPPAPAPCLDAGQLVGIEYALRVTVKVTGCGNDVTDEATLYIGHIPVVGTQDDYEPPMKDQLPSGPIPVKPLLPQMPQAGEKAPFIQSYPQAPVAQQMQYGAPQNMPYPQPYTGGNNPPYPAYNPAGYQQHNAGQNAPAPQINWQWNGGPNPQVGYSNPSAPSAPSM